MTCHCCDLARLYPYLNILICMTIRLGVYQFIKKTRRSNIFQELIINSTFVTVSEILIRHISNLLISWMLKDSVQLCTTWRVSASVFLGPLGLCRWELSLLIRSSKTDRSNDRGLTMSDPMVLQVGRWAMDQLPILVRRFCYRNVTDTSTNISVMSSWHRTGMIGEH